MPKNYYAILGVTSHATPEDIRAAFHRLARDFHPDRYAGARETFLDIEEAYSVLSDAERRKTYDRQTAPRPAPSPAEPMMTGRRSQPEPLIPREGRSQLGDISTTRSFQTFTPSFDEIYDRLWGNFGDAAPPKSEQIRSLTLEVPITPEEARRGGQARVLVPAEATCPTCRGRGGIEDYECLRCGGVGVIADEFPVMVTYPPGLTHDHSVLVSLDSMGIQNLYLDVHFRLTASEV